MANVGRHLRAGFLNKYTAVHSQQSVPARLTPLTRVLLGLITVLVWPDCLSSTKIKMKKKQHYLSVFILVSSGEPLIRKDSLYLILL